MGLTAGDECRTICTIGFTGFTSTTCGDAGTWSNPVTTCKQGGLWSHHACSLCCKKCLSLLCLQTQGQKHMQLAIYMFLLLWAAGALPNPTGHSCYEFVHHGMSMHLS